MRIVKDEYREWCKNYEDYKASGVPRTLQNFLNYHGNEFSHEELSDEFQSKYWTEFGKNLIKSYLQKRRNELMKIWTEP